MDRTGHETSFSRDSRAVSEVVGFIFIFAIIVILMSINQAQLVPTENSEIEFQHFQEVRNELVEVRSSISEAGQADVSQYPTVRLGTKYPPRLFAVNPPPSSGTLQTSPAYNISIDNGAGDDPKNVSTRFLEYRNGYNEMDIGSIWYEHSVLYLDERDNGGGIAIYEDQNVITGNNSAHVTALQNDFRISSTGRVTLDLYPTENASVNSSDLEGNVTVKIPSRLNDSVYWGGAIDTTESGTLWYHGTEPYPGESDIYWVNLTVKADALKFNTVGINGEPENQGSINRGVGSGSETGGGEEGNPPSVDTLDANQRGNSSKIDVDWVVSDPDGDLNEVEIVLREEDAEGDIVDSVLEDVDGDSASGETAFEKGDGVTRGHDYHIELTVTDEARNFDSDTDTVEIPTTGNGGK